MLYVIIGVAAVAAVIAVVAGLVKGFTRTSTWAVEYLLAALITILIYSLVDVENDVVYAALVIGTAVVLLLLFALSLRKLKSFIGKKAADARKRCYYQTYFDREEYVMQIIDALELNDKKAYRRLTNRDMKESSGGAGVADRIVGAVNLLLKALIICAMTALIVLTALQFTQLSFVTEGGSLYSIYSSSFWESISPYIFDLIIIAILQFAIRAGYRMGIIRSLWSLCVLALVIGAGYVSYYLVFNVAAFESLAEGFASNVSFISSLGDTLSEIVSSVDGTTIAQIIIMIIMFIVLLILVCVVGGIVSGAISRAREDKFVSTLDGVLGAVIITVIVIAVLLFAGFLLYSFVDFEFMELFNSYCYTEKDGEMWSSAVFSSIYSRNPLNEYLSEIQETISGYFR